ncbi:MAG TPA: protein translocase subunit SecF [Dermatophilaceae bacterium]|nr:protein translocase subunit SecF [Dermatophilaceae bacterium]
MPNFAQLGNDLYTGKRSIDFIGRQKQWYAFSAVLIALALVGIFARGLNFGIEFRGGSEYRLTGISDVSNYETKARSAIAEAGIGGNVLSTVIGGNSVRVQTEAAGEHNEAAKAALAKAFGIQLNTVSASLIGPSWGASVTSKALQALIIFLVLLALVMAIYFRTWKMAAAGLVALLHDLLVTVGIYALAGFEITPASMIGFLTILGYSLYDTVVVFDKVRENTTEAMGTRRTSYAAAANLAVNQTLVRSINTTVVALLPIVAILIVGVTKIGPGTLLDLALALFVGIAVGAYSSIFIATPLLVDLRRNEPGIVELEKHAAKLASRERADQAVQDAPVGTTRTVPAKASSTRVSAPVDAPSDPAGDSADEATDGGESEEPVLTDAAGRPLHKWASTGPRNQPKRTPRARR